MFLNIDRNLSLKSLRLVLSATKRRIISASESKGVNNVAASIPNREKGVPE